MTLLVDPFAILGLPRSFDVDCTAAERAHRDLSRALHPDKFVGAGSSERRAALTKAVEVNEAWRVVRDPIRRAEALLKLSGISVGEDSESTTAPEFLMEMLEQREALSDAKRARDIKAIRAMAEAIGTRVQEVHRLLSAGFASGEWHGLASKVSELRFYGRLLEEVGAIEDELAA